MRYKDVKRIIDEWDCLGLLGSCGCPPDEYDIETYPIWKAAFDISDAKSLSFTIYDIFHQYFGDTFNYYRTVKDCKDVAEKILKLEGEKIELNYICPLLEQEISEAFCCDINMVAVGNCTQMSMYEKIDRDTLKRGATVCVSCENSYWGKDELSETLEGDCDD